MNYGIMDYDVRQVLDLPITTVDPETGEESTMLVHRVKVVQHIDCQPDKVVWRDTSMLTLTQARFPQSVIDITIQQCVDQLRNHGE